MKKSFILFSIFFCTVLYSQVVHQIYFDRFSHYSSDDWVTYAPALDITSIDVGEDYIFFGTRNGGILRYNDYPYTSSNGLQSNKIYRIVYEFSDNRWYAQTSKGIDELNKAFKYWQPSSKKVLPQQRSPEEYQVDDYRQNPNYNFPQFYRPDNSELPDFFTDRQYLFRPPDEILDEENRIFHFNNDRVVDNWRNLWLTTDGLGPAKANLNEQTLKFYQKSISNIQPRDLYFDGNKVWIGGISEFKEPAGINFWNLDKDTWKYYEARYNYNLQNDNCFAITGNKEYIFCGTEQGVCRYDKKGKEWNTLTTINGLESNKINDLIIWKNSLVIATDEGFNFMLPDARTAQESKNTTLDNVPVFKISATDSLLYFATREGIYQYELSNDDLQFVNTGSAILDLYISAVNIQTDTIWAAGEYGIIFYDPVGDRWQSFTNIRQAVFGTIYDINFSGNNIWFATDDGLLKYDKKRDYWYLYTEKDGLADRHVYSVTVDADDLWLCTNAGLTLFRWYRGSRTE